MPGGTRAANGRFACSWCPADLGARLPASVDGVCHRGQLGINMGLQVTTSGQPHRAPCPAVAAAARRTHAAPPHPLCWRLQPAPPARRASRAGRQTAMRAAQVTCPAADPTSGLRCETLWSWWSVKNPTTLISWLLRCSAAAHMHVPQHSHRRRIVAHSRWRQHRQAVLRLSSSVCAGTAKHLL